MGTGDWRYSSQDRVDAAMEFLTNGNVSGGLTAYGTESNDYDTIRGCFDSSDCAAGWSCSDGRCRQPGSIGTNIQTISGLDGTRYGSSSASCPTDETDISVPLPDISDCGGGGGYGYGGDQATGGCDKPGCGGGGSSYGGGGGGSDCCGGRCCRFLSTGASTGLRVQCYCGDCPPPKRCQKWCDIFKKVNGRDGEGCSNATSCSECETCVTILGGQIAECKPITSGAPCHCGGSNACRGACDECKSDGTCEENCANCESCITMYNTNCGCAFVSTRCCSSACSTGSLSWVGCKNKACESACPPGDGPEKDPCEGVCTTRTYCEEGPPPDCDTPPCATPPGSPSCPPGSSCTNLGFISAGGETCYLEKVCDKSGVPDFCDDCDCNCHNDCPDCQLCGADGKCYPDPECDKCLTPTVRFTGSPNCTGDYAELVYVGTNCDFNGVAGWSCSRVYALRTVGSCSWTLSQCGGGQDVEEPVCLGGLPTAAGPVVEQCDCENPELPPTFTPGPGDCLA